MSLRFWALASGLLCAISLTGCSKFFGDLRRDLDDTDAYSSAPPTTGGRFAEEGMLSDDDSQRSARTDRYAAVGHSERGLASAGSDDAPAGDRWGNGTGDAGGDSARMSGEPSPAPDASKARKYKSGFRATRADFVDEANNEGSLWSSDGQTNYYLTKNKVRGVGDLVTVTAENDLVRDVSTEIARTLDADERQAELDAAQTRMARTGPADPNAAAGGAQAGAPPAGATAQAGQDGGRSPAFADGAGGPRRATMADIDLTKSIGFKAGDPVMAEIIERYPNGNYKIRGTKKIPYRGSYRYVSLLGIVKGSDIGEDDSVASGKLYEYRLDSQQQR